MREVDAILEDADLLDAVFEAQGQRPPTRPPPNPLRGCDLQMLILKHIRNWSYETLDREVRANLVYRAFCRIGLENVPDAKTLVRLGQVIGSEVIYP